MFLLHRCQPWSSWDINCNKVGFGAGRWDRKPFPPPRGIIDLVRDISAVLLAMECVIIINRQTWSLKEEFSG